MRTFYLILSSLILITSIFSQDKTFKLKDGTVIIGTIQEETNSTLIVQTKFGLVTINKSELIHIQYEVKLKSGKLDLSFSVLRNGSISPSVLSKRVLTFVPKISDNFNV